MDLESQARVATSTALLEGDLPLEVSFIELVVAVSACSEDQGEIFDLMDHLLAADRVELRPERDLAA